ncbi:MAG: tetratricopeptide repeat protein [Planctomycetota bacterium]
MTPVDPLPPTTETPCAGSTPENAGAAKPPVAAKGGIRKSRASRWRVLVLVSIHVLFAVHLTHWFLAGRTVSPVEPSESMFFLERGELNAGFILFSAAILSTVLLGRFFCGWGCHIVALQDLCGYFMKRLGIRPRLFRSRLLVYIPLILALYMFVWPSFRRWILHPLAQAYWPDLYASWIPIGPFPPITNHLMTDDFWATFASVWVAIPFLLVCGFATVYFLGAKGFCTYGCPYGGFFYPADRLAVGRILANLDVCEKCGHCTASCTSNVQIHKEIQLHSQVVDPGCMKCLDCVSVCPTGALSFGWGRPSLFAKGGGKRGQRLKRTYDLTWPEELLIAGVVAGVFFAVRGVYALVPMLFAIGLAVCAGFIAWKQWRLFRDREVRLHRFVLKRGGEWQTAGRVFTALVTVATALTLHSAVVNAHLRAGERRATTVARFVDYETLLGGMPPGLYSEKYRQLAAEAFDHYEAALPFWRGGWGLLLTPGLDSSLARMALVTGELPKSEAHLRAARSQKADDETTYQLARVLVLQARTAEAEEELSRTLAMHPEYAVTRRELSKLYLGTNRADRAAQIYEEHLRGTPIDTLARCRLALEILVPAQQIDAALATLERALELGPESPERAETLDSSVTLLARELGARGRFEDARRLVDAAREKRPLSLVLLREAALLARHHGERDRAKQLYESALSADWKNRIAVDYASTVLLPAGELEPAESTLVKVLAALDEAPRDDRPAAEVDHALAALAGALEQRGDGERARELLRTVLSMRAELPAARSALANSYLASDQAEAAEALLRERTNDTSGDALAHAQLANLYLRLGRYPEAEAEFATARRVDPHNGLIRADLALVYFQQGDLPRAIAETRAALELAPHQLMIIGRLSELLALAGQAEEAAEWQRRMTLLQQMGGGA